MNLPFSPSGIVTLTTDFGLREPFVAVMKAQLLRGCPSARLVDITHEIPCYQPAVAGFWLSHAAPYFPIGTLHLAVVDPGVGTSRALLGVAAAGQLFLGPDNGLLTRISRRVGAVSRLIDLAGPAGRGLATASATFHGRDILAPIAGELLAGTLRFEELGSEAIPLPCAELGPAVCSGNLVHGQVEVIDKFGNIISNIERELVAHGQVWTASCSGACFRWVRTYAEASPGELVALVNSWGLVELAMVEGDAASRLGVRRGDSLTLQPGDGA